MCSWEDTNRVQGWRRTEQGRGGLLMRMGRKDLALEVAFKPELRNRQKPLCQC